MQAQANRSLHFPWSVHLTMLQRDSSRGSSRLINLVSVAQTILKEPMREAVQEALEEERQRARKEHESQSDMDVSSKRRESNDRGTSGERTRTGADQEQEGGSSSRLKFVALLVGIGIIGYLVRRRGTVMESEPISSRLYAGSERDEPSGERMSHRVSETGAGAAVRDS